MARRPRLPRRKRPSIPDRVSVAENLGPEDELIGQLEACFTGSNDPRPGLIQTLKSYRDAVMADLRERFEKGRIDGLETARLIAAAHDQMIRAIYTVVTDRIIVAENPTAAEHMAVCAVGGYGRGEMAPGSDLDLLFLQSSKKGSAYTESVTEYMLYLLWDTGLKVGHSTRSADQCLKLAKSDQTILTALLDLRFICGDEDLAQALYARFRKDITRGKGRAYIASKLEERDIRHDREGNSRYVIEPNIKEGKGGLRDLHVLYWIARFLDKDGKITDAQQAEDYVEMGLFDEAAAKRFVRAADFLWRARIHLHFDAGRPVETLSFDRQIVLARKMGYASGPIEEAVEKFMREYFINARHVGALTRIACAKLEAEKSLLLPKGLDALLPNSKRNMKDPEFVLDHGRLMFKDPMTIRDNPGQILKLFEIAGRRNLDIHPDAFAAIAFRQNLIDNDFRRNPNNAAIFREILLGSKAPYATLKVMNESGVLGRYLLEFGGIVARTQFNMHHAYTVDEHSLHLVNHFHNYEFGERKESNPELTDIIQSFDRDERLCLYLACLLHDTGKGQGDQCIEGARLARRACRRLGLSKTNTDTIAWLVRHHLDMSETAQRRDISNPETIERFAGLIGSQSRLRMLYALTVVDIKSVGPGIWNDWKKVLLRNLYENTSRFLEGHSDMATAATAMAVRQQFEDRFSPDKARRVSAITDGLGDSYWNGFDMADLIRHGRWFDQLIKQDKRSGINIRLDRPRDITELWVLGEDRSGLFADLTLAVSACGAQIVGARLTTGDGGQVMDVFYLQNSENLAFGRKNQRMLEQLESRASRALSGDVSGLSISSSPPSRRAAAIPVEPVARILDAGNSGTVIIEIEGRDRKGLLYDLAQTLLAHGLDILSAHVEVVGTRAIDAFYVRPITQTGELSVDKKTNIQNDLLTVLSDKARASAA